MSMPVPKPQCREEVTLLKKTGEQFKGIKANIQPTLITSYDVHFPVEEGDTLYRELSNGSIEEYVVIDRGYHDREPKKPRFQMEVLKKGTLELKRSFSTPSISITGDHSRVLINSQDNSINFDLTKDNIFQTIRDELVGKLVVQNDLEIVLKKLDELEEAKDTGTFKDRYLEFISAVANHITIISPFLPALQKLFLGI
jgi:hypothetical protein